MRLIKVLFFLALFISCQTSRHKSDVMHIVAAPITEPLADNDSIKSELVFITHNSYKESLSNIYQKRKNLASAYKDSNSPLEKKRLLAQAGDYFEHALLDTLMPHWYGTPWEFNGHTNEPGKGEVACGYLVSTTLRHMGLELNRYKMAQQSAMSEAKTLCLEETEVVIHYSSDASPKPSAVCAGLTGGLYLVGLSNHVGFLLIRNEGHYFIHSDYVSGEVRFENAQASAAFQSSIYCYAPITTNEALMTRWLNQEEVPIVLD